MPCKPSCAGSMVSGPSEAMPPYRKALNEPNIQTTGFEKEVTIMPYKGKQFEDIIWYCDNCGDRLDLQPFFSDWRGSWRCKKCGFKNEISAENIDWDGDMDNQE